jgi:hypothetical protein
LEQREIQILLSYITDPRAKAVIESTFSELGSGFKTSQEAAAALDAELNQVVAKLARVGDPRMRAAGLEGVASLRQVGQAALEAAQETGTLNTEFAMQRQQVRQLGSDVDNLDKKVRTSTVSIRNFGGAMRYALIGAGLQRIGTALTRTSQNVIGLATSYARGQPEEAAAKRWADQMKRIEESQVRIGRALSTQLLPFLKQAADLMQSAADFAEKHPEAVKAVAALTIGGAITGKILTAVAAPFYLGASGLRVFGGLGGAAAAGGTTGGIGAALAGAVPVLGAVTLSVLAAIGAKGLYEKLKQPEQPGGFGGMLKEAGKGAITIGGMVGVGVGALLDKLGILDDGASTAAKLTNWLVKSIDDLGESADQTAPKIAKVLDPEAIQAYIDYRKADARAEQEYSAERSDIVTKTAQERNAIEARFGAERTKLTADFARAAAQALEEFNFDQARQARDFAQSESQTEADYYAERTEALKGYQQDVRRAEEDHQREMQKLRAEHEQRIEDLVASRDALGIVREMRSYERQRTQAEKEHTVEMQRMKADAADRLRQMESQFTRERARRLAEFEQKQADQKEDFDRQQEQQLEAYKVRLAEIEGEQREELQKLQQKGADQLRELDSQYREERQRRRNAFIDQLRDLDVFQGQMKTAYETYYADLSRQFEDFVANLEALGPEAVGSKQAGGYVQSGLWRLHAGEFVLNPQTTRRAERFVGGRLTQGALIGSLAQAGGGISIGNITLPGTNLNEQQLNRFMQDKFPLYLKNAFDRALGVKIHL